MNIVRSYFPVVKKAITPRALEHWGRRISFGNRAEIQACQLMKYGLPIAEALNPGNMDIMAMNHVLDNKVSFLQQSPYRYSEEFNQVLRSASKRLNRVFWLVSAGPLAGIALKNLADNHSFSFTDAAIVSASSLGMLVIGHFLKNTTMRALVAEQSAKETQRVSEEKFQNAPVGMHTLDREGRIKEVNVRWCQMMGYAEKEVVRHFFTEFVLPEQMENAMARFQARMRGEDPPDRPGDRIYVTKDKTPIIVRTKDTMIKNDQGVTIGVQIFLENITAVKKQKEAEASRLAFTWGFEMLKGFGDYMATVMQMLQTVVPEKYSDKLKEAIVAKQLIDELSEALREESSETRSGSLEISLMDVLKGVVDDFKLAEQNHGAILEIDFTPTEDKFLITFDYIKLSRALQLILMSEKYMAKRSGSQKTKLRLGIEREAGNIVVSIEDSIPRSSPILADRENHLPLTSGYQHQHLEDLRLGLAFFLLKETGASVKVKTAGKHTSIRISFRDTIQ